MSSIARWSYKYKATVTPYLGIDGVSGSTQYGAPYEIDCNVTAVTNTDVRAIGGIDGDEWIGQHVIYTEDTRPKKGDMIEFPGSAGKEQIKRRTMWDMAMFGDVPDYKLET